MNLSVVPPARSRPTDLGRESSRRSRQIAETLGDELRRTRHRLRMTQRGLAARVGVHQTWISDIELGRGQVVPLELWVALGVAVGRPLAMSFSKTIDASAVADAGHLEIQEHVLGSALRNGLTATFELPTRPADPSRSTDVGIHDPRRRIRLLVECWNTFGDVGAAIRATHRKTAQAAGTWPDDRTAAVWVVRSSAANRALIVRYPNLFRSMFDGSSRAWARALTDGGDPPSQPGLVWFDGRPARIRERRARD